MCKNLSQYFNFKYWLNFLHVFYYELLSVAISALLELLKAKTRPDSLKLMKKRKAMSS